MNKTALIVIDVQNDYFLKGKFPLWNTQQTLENTLAAVELAKAQSMPIILVQHISDAAGLFAKGEVGTALHPDLESKAANAERVIKTFADGFEQTNLEATLQAHQVDTLLICGMMTQNCVTHTAISKAAEKYHVTILQDACTTVDENIHAFALNALSTRLPLTSVNDALS
ncbi:cysteine hydrolase family protein [Marinomonas transparens]|uniref:Cysteine hydrolase n=1 Tax=Marinomonas transparens TaxID=2795388 RepID=A0A934JSF9_9GAMM|nr:cysteine hydrolase family protein [Marinomonas transparens]MBJ7536247.1 cysteine hydrolase [Marinomonas transparens]